MMMMIKKKKKEDWGERETCVTQTVVFAFISSSTYDGDFPHRHGCDLVARPAVHT
jgi:hypothetical protein